MNDFTKEELIEIKIALQDKVVEKKYNYSDLIYKVQSMIDNYCEHIDKLLVNDCKTCCIKEFRCNVCATINYEGIE